MSAPKPDNFDQLTATWNDPSAFAIERARYYAQLRALDAGVAVDFTEPRHPRDDNPREQAT